MKTIHKYEIKPETLDRTGEFTLHLPKDLEVLHIGLDPRMQVCIWARIPEIDETEWIIRRFRCVMTGQEIPDDELYIATVLRNDLMLHFFEIK